MKGLCILHALSLCDSLILNSGGSVQCLLFYLSKDHCIILNLQMQGFWQSMSQPVPDSPFRRWVQNASRRCFPCATLQREFYQLSHLLQEQQPFTGAWNIWYSHFSISLGSCHSLCCLTICINKQSCERGVGSSRFVRPSCHTMGLSLGCPGCQIPTR